MDAVLFQPSDLYIRKHDINMCDAFYHEESKCWLFWTLDSTFYVYLREIQMDSFCPEPRLDHVQVFGYFLCGVSGTTIYMYDWSTWALVYSHDYKQPILKFGLVHNDIYVLTNDNILYKASKVEQKNIHDLLCVSTQVFYHTSSHLCTPEMSVDAKYILSLFADDEYIYALRNRKRVDYWEHTLAHRQTINSRHRHIEDHDVRECAISRAVSQPLKCRRTVIYGVDVIPFEGHRARQRFPDSTVIFGEQHLQSLFGHAMSTSECGKHLVRM